MTERILNIKCAVEKNIGGIARHVTSTAVIEIFEGDLVWEGVVETFDVACNPNVKRCYAFTYRENDSLGYATVTETGAVNSPEAAVKTFIASRCSDESDG
ncbi:MAG TPA: hypothetical protein VGY75_11040 [Candidatus Udaeobacter sp.]|jgi:hypothetical protein|nr:hypothetical protein [Candidatus Udaeobacter sp.]